MKFNRIFNIFTFCLLVFLAGFGLAGCTEKNKNSVQAQKFAGSESAPADNIPMTRESSSKEKSSKESEHVRIGSSVKTVKDEYIPLLNTNVFIKTDGNSHGEELADRIEKEIIYYHKLFDQYHYYYDDKNEGTVKNLAILNEHIALARNFSAEKELAELLKKSLNLMELTGSRFNIFINPVLALYDGLFSPFPVVRKDPDSQKIKEALEKVLSAEKAKKIISFDENQVCFYGSDLSGLSINFGGIAKGYVADKILEKFGGEKFILSLGSSTIVSCGRTAKIGIASPYYRTLPLFQVNLPEKIALSTSSTTNNYYISESDGKTVRSHIIDPETGYSQNYYWAVIVLCSDAAVSDALSTGLFNIGEISEIMRIIKQVRAEYGCFLEVCFVKDFSAENKQVTLLMTEGFEPYINKEYEGIGIAEYKVLSEN